MEIQKDITNAKSIAFLRPVFNVLRNTSDSVLVECLFSRMAGYSELVLVDTEYQLKQLIRGLPSQTIVRWKVLSRPDFRNEPSGLMPNKDGRLVYGAY
jgi:hypothetical protein